MSTTVILLTLLCSGIFSDSLQDPKAMEIIKNQFEAIRKTIETGNHKDRKHLIISMPEMPGKWSDIFASENYLILRGSTDSDGKIHGMVRFVFGPSKNQKMLGNVYLIENEKSISNWSMTIENAELKNRQKRYADDDCEWWGCIDG